MLSAGYLDEDELQARIAEALSETEQWSDPLVTIVGERGVGRSTLINSLRGLRPGEEGAATVGADEVLTEEQRAGTAFYEHCGMLFHDVPGCRGNELDVNMGEEYIRRFNLDNADGCLFVYINVLSVQSLRCARLLEERGVPVYFVRNKVDVDCQNEIDDGNATSERDALERMRRRAYEQMIEWGFDEFADENHLFLVSSRYKDAVEANPPRFDFGVLKEGIATTIKDEVRRAAVKHVLVRNARELERVRAEGCCFC